jgi:hypothetical protein
MGMMRNAYKILVGRPERKRALGRPANKREDNIKTDVKVKNCEGVEWISLAHAWVQ